MKLKTKDAQQRNKDAANKKRPFQDDSAIILAAAVILIVAQAYVFSALQDSAKPKKVIIKAQTDDVARTVNQNLSTQRQSIEEYIKRYLFVPDNRADNPALANRRPAFSEAGWQGYLAYLADQQSRLPVGEGLNAEFVFGSQKYAVLGDDSTAFKADGMFCFGVDQNYRCGPQRFVIEVLMSGSISSPDALTFEMWKVAPPPVTATP